MRKKENRLSIGGLIFSIFLLLCAIINFAGGHIGAAICSVGAGIFYLVLSSALYEKRKEGKA